MSAVVASLPAPAVSAPHAILLTPSGAGSAAGSASGRAKLFYHPFFPLLHLMHFPHLFLGAGLGHHGLGGFHHGLGGFHHGLGGFHPGLGYGHFPFRALPPEPTKGAQAGSGASPEASVPTPPPPVSSTARTEPPARPSGTTRLAPLAHADQPQPARYVPPPPFKAFITPKRKVVPVYPVPAYPLPALPPLPAYATFDGPLRLTEPPAAPEPTAEPDLNNSLVYAGLPVPPAYVTKAESSAASNAPAAASAAASVHDDQLPWCECPEDGHARVELDHSVAHTSEKPSSAPSSPGPLAPPPTVAPAPAHQGQDSSPELPQRRDKDDDHINEVEANAAVNQDTAPPTDSRVLIVVGEQPAAAPAPSDRDPEAAAEQTTEQVIDQDQATEEEEGASTTEFATTVSSD